MFLRVDDFVAKHSDRFPRSSTGGQMLARLARAIAQIEAQDSARFTAVAEGRHGTAARAAVKEWMRTIARTSRDVSRRQATRSVPLRMPSKVNDEALLAAARAFLDRGTRESEAFVQLGLDANWHDAFRAALDTFEGSLKDRRSGRYGASAAHASIKAALADGTDAIRTLDVVVANTLKGDPVLTPVWQRCRRIVTTEAAQPDASPANTAPSVPASQTDDALKQAS